jgi:hypothetical protein
MGGPLFQSPPTTFYQPDGSTIHSTTSTTLDIMHTALPPAALQAHVVPTLVTPLISIGQLCNYGCNAYFTNRRAYIIYNDNVIMTGYRSNIDGLWRINLPDRTTAILQGKSVLDNKLWRTRNSTCNALVPQGYTTAQRVAYLHACMGSPALSTFLSALDAGFLDSVPLKAWQVRKFPPNSEAMWKGHLDLSRANQRSTKPSRALFLGVISNLKADLDINHRPGRIYSDITGKFIIPSSQGNNYLLVVYDYDSNFIFAEPMANRNSETILKTYQPIHDAIVASGATPVIHITDN